MKRFRFPLHGLARLRQQQVQQQERRLASALARLKSAEEVRNRIAAQLEQTVQSIPAGDEWTMAQRISVDQDQEQLRRALAAASEQARNESRNVLEERERLAAVEKDREVLDRLREQKQMEYMRELMREEQLELDEQGLQKFQRDEAA